MSYIFKHISEFRFLSTNFFSPTHTLLLHCVVNRDCSTLHDSPLKFAHINTVYNRPSSQLNCPTRVYLSLAWGSLTWAWQTNSKLRRRRSLSFTIAHSICAEPLGTDRNSVPFYSWHPSVTQFSVQSVQSVVFSVFSLECTRKRVD